ncbi:MAG: DUF2017 family protein [Planctomycetes bacterium]|nr:DUF2017 family protein [Planctomycetota bacterium]
MNYPRIEIQADGTLVLRCLSASHVFALREVPEILRDDDPDVRARLFPNSYENDPEREAEWDRYSRPDLIALFDSRREIVERDLESILSEPVWRGYRLTIPGTHKSAWMAALNAARIALAVRAGIDARDMEAELDFENPSAKHLALFRIHVLGHLLGLIVESGNPDIEFEFDGDDFDDFDGPP